MTGNKLWITGGNSGSAPSTSEFVTPGQDSEKGPDLPAAMGRHCMVHLDDDTIMFLGSSYNSERSSQNTYVYSVNDDSFTLGPQLTKPKYAMTCGVIEDDGGNKIVVVAGGSIGGSSYIDEIETWVPGSELDTFNIIGHLPNAVYGGAGVITPDKKSLIVIGGYDGSYLDSLYKITCTTTECNVETMPQKLKVARHLIVAMLIPDSLANCN